MFSVLEYMLFGYTQGPLASEPRAEKPEVEHKSPPVPPFVRHLTRISGGVHRVSQMPLSYMIRYRMQLDLKHVAILTSYVLVCQNYVTLRIRNRIIV